VCIQNIKKLTGLHAGLEFDISGEETFYSGG